MKEMELTSLDVKRVQCLSGLNQVEFAKHIGYTPVHVSNILTGKTKPPKHMYAILLTQFKKEMTIVKKLKEEEND